MNFLVFAMALDICKMNLEKLTSPEAEKKNGNLIS